MTDIAANLTLIRHQIAQLELKYHRKPGSVQLLAASKTQSVETIRTAMQAGQRWFGENYLQEAQAKIMALADQSIEWHFIGPIQRNKTRKIAELFTWVHSVDDMTIAQRLNDQRPPELPPLHICIEVNVSGETSKSGTELNNVEPLALFCQRLPRLRLRGLMTIPAITHDFNAERRAFKTLFELQRGLYQQGFELDTLSMGMSNDFEAAIAEGATLIRIGSAIFGARSTT